MEIEMVMALVVVMVVLVVFVLVMACYSVRKLYEVISLSSSSSSCTFAL